MYSAEQIAELVLSHSREITALQESTKSAHHRIAESNKMSAGINDLTKSITEMTAELKHLTKRMDSSIDKIEAGQKAQGERIGTLEKAVFSIARIEKYIEEHDKRLDAIEKAPAHKWDKFMWLIFAGVATAIIALLMGHILGGV